MLEYLLEQSVALQNYKFVSFIGVALVGLVVWMQRILANNDEGSRTFKSELTPEADVALSARQRCDQPIQSHLEEKPHVPFGGAKILHPGGVGEFYAMANDRRSVRHFSSRPISIADVEMAILAAGTSPSGAHTQPWTFCLIQDHRVKAQIRDIVEAEEYLNYNQRMARQWTVDLTPLKTDYGKEYLTDAPCLILVFKQTYGFRTDGQRQHNYYHEISAAISTGILLTALQSAGLNSLVTTPLNCGPALRTLLQRPVNEKLLVLLPVGYAADDCLVPDLQRKSLTQILVKY